MIVDYDGRILAQAEPGPGEKVIVAPIDLSALRSERARRFGHDMRSHLRSEMYRYLDHPWFPGASPAEHPLTAESIRDRIRIAKERTEVGR
jgi:hypothetical protein